MNEQPAEQEPAPDVWPLLHAWAEEIASEDFSDAVSLDTLCELWENRPLQLQRPTLAEAIADDWFGSPAVLPDETWPVSYEHARQLQQHRGRVAGWHPPSAA